MNEIKVPFMIWGNPLSNAGFNPIFYFNKPTFTAPADTSPAGMNANDYYFTVNISPAFTTVVLIQNNVKSAGASRAGTLKFAMALPKGMRVKGGFTPYEVLKSMRDLYVRDYMDPIRGDVPGYRFREDMGSEAPLQALLDNYTLEPANLPHRPMNGQTAGFLQVGQQQMHDLFSDLQYPEFTPFKEIVVAETGTLNPHVAIRTIPRMPNWRLTVNNVPRNWPQPNLAAPMRITDTSRNPQYWDDTTVEFTIDDARKGMCPNVTVDEASETVHVSLSPRPKIRRINIRLNGAPLSELDRFTFRVGNRQLKANNGVLELRAEDIVQNPRPVYNGAAYTVSGNHTDGDNMTINLSKKQQPHSRIGGRNQFDDISGNDGTAMNLTIEIYANKHADKFVNSKVVIEKYSGRGYESYSERPGFSATTTPQGNVLKTDISVPAHLKGQVNVFVKNSLGKASTACNIPMGNQPVRFYQNQFVKKNDSSINLLGIILICCALLAGIAGGYFLHSWLGNSADKQTEGTEQTEQTEHMADWYKDDAEWEKISQTLQDPELQFAQVGQFSSQIDAVRDSEDFKNEAAGKYSDIISSVEAYQRIINAIKSKDLEEIKKASTAINVVHSDMLLAIDKGWVDAQGRHQYTGEGVEAAKKEFSTGEYNSFRDIDNIHTLYQSKEYKGGLEPANGRTSNPTTNNPAAPGASAGVDNPRTQPGQQGGRQTRQNSTRQTGQQPVNNTPANGNNVNKQKQTPNNGASSSKVRNAFGGTGEE